MNSFTSLYYMRQPVYMRIMGFVNLVESGPLRYSKAEFLRLFFSKLNFRYGGNRQAKRCLIAYQ